MKIIYRDGLLFTTIEIAYGDRIKVVEDVVIDTGTTHTIISPDVVDDIGIRYGLGDKIKGAYGIGGRQYAFEKQVKWIKFGSFCIGSHNIHFGIIDSRGIINGLLGLDLLLEVGAVVDLKQLLLYEGK